MYFDSLPSSTQKSLEPCRPDPEESLQRSRKRIEELVQAKENIMNGAGAAFDAPEQAKNGILMAIGAIEFSIASAKTDEAYWLKECESGD